MLKRRKAKVSDATRPNEAQSLEGLLGLWKRQAECLKLNADRLAESEDYESAAQNSWISTVFGWCAEDLERSLELYKFETYWKPEKPQRSPRKKRKSVQ